MVDALVMVIHFFDVSLISRNGYDRAPLFRAPFEKLQDARLPTLVLDGEIAVPDEKSVTPYRPAPFSWFKNESHACWSNRNRDRFVFD